MEEYDVIILGAGPAGLFAAFCLKIEKINKDLKILILDKSKNAGGMGLHTDGKLNFDNRIGMELDEIGISKLEVNNIILLVKNIFDKFGLNEFVKESEYDIDINSKLSEIEKIASDYSVEFLRANQVHVGSDNLPIIVERFVKYLEDSGVEIKLNTRVKDVLIDENGKFLFCISGGKTYKSKIGIISPGRTGSSWFKKISNRLDVNHKHKSIDVGVRFETSNDIMKKITDYCYDPKFIYRTKCHGDVVRTFCTNPGGYVVLENDKSFEVGNLKCINGYARKDKKSENTNFAILVNSMLTEPYEDTLEFAKNILESTYRVGGGKPIIQRLGDFMRGSRSKLETFNLYERGYDHIEPTMKMENLTCGDIHLCYFSRFVNDIKEFIEVLDNIIPGISHPSNLLYVPEVKLWVRYPTNKMETNVRNLYVAGDGVGKSRGIVGAAVSGVITAFNILEKNGRM